MLAPAPADYLFLVDTTATWTTRADRYAGVVDALGTEYAAPISGLRRLAFFPALDGAGATACDAAAYATPALDWGVDGDAAALAAARPFAGESALAPALEAAIDAARARLTSDPARSVSIVLVTDTTVGDDEACTPADLADVAPITAAAFALGRGTSVHTHVLSIVSGAVSPDHFARLDDLAGLSGASSLVNGGRADVARSLGTALANVRARMDTCVVLAPGFVPEELRYTFPDGNEEVLHRVDDASGCAAEPNGFWADDDGTPHTLTVCSGPAGVGGACERVFVRAGAVGAPTASNVCL